jgi:hypothetical protein
VNETKDVQSPIDPDIVTLLTTIARRQGESGTPEYTHGKEEGVLETIKALFGDLASFQNNTIKTAELYYALVEKLFPSVKIVELRIGVDYSSYSPVAIAIISSESKPYIRSLMDLARQIELFEYNQSHYDGFVWTLIDEGLDRNQLTSDFPLFRVVKK